VFDDVASTIHESLLVGVKFKDIQLMMPDAVPIGRALQLDPRLTPG
jgi:hypothetical protein